MSRSTSPANRWVPITPSDSTDIPQGSPSALICSGAGNVVLVDYLGNEMTRAFAIDTIYPFQAMRVKSTGTTATGIYGLYNS
ncbi:spike base protein, RCAP_Rcc01079 family [Sphingobium sp. CAP-1]|uniref:spike base protein, RCAP_Rcc01079 family n=1 Tax=Sphingobium sp. CAP-1 TaxID=2676077 RepID=UPI0012BB1FFC|nr:hypothetical protein [Sphingobium sp. CAP-1]QGP80005.1 hypothetical protein GL174_14190 [Sphingobium sp. CAP-1]